MKLNGLAVALGRAAALFGMVQTAQADLVSKKATK